MNNEDKKSLILNFGTLGAPLILAIIYLIGEVSVVTAISMAMLTVTAMYMMRLNVLDTSNIFNPNHFENFKEFVHFLVSRTIIIGLFVWVLFLSLFINNILEGIDNVILSVVLAYMMFVGYNSIAYILTVAVFDPIIYFAYKFQKM